MNANATKTNPKGAGRNPYKIKIPKGPFSVKTLFALNDKATGGVMKCKLTARNHVLRGLAKGLLVKLPVKDVTGKVGAPSFLFQLKSAYDYNQKRRGNKTAVVATPAE